VAAEGKWPQVAASGRRGQVAASGRKWPLSASGRKWPPFPISNSTPNATSLVLFVFFATFPFFVSCFPVLNGGIFHNGCPLFPAKPNPRTLKEFSSELIKGETRLLQAGAPQPM